jgi:hypothetical protein
MQVYYDNIEINHQFLTKGVTQMQPKVIYNAFPNKLYTLIMHDPNAVTGNYLHWLVINIPGNQINSGKNLLPYKGPNPPVNSGIHRYIFILLEQTTEITVDSWNDTERIMEINILYDKLNLKKMDEIASTYFEINSQNGGKRLRNKKTRVRRKRRTLRKSIKNRTRRVYK